MKKILTLLIIFLPFSQVSSQTLKSTEDKALLFMLIVDKDDRPITETITIRSEKTKKEYTCQSDKQGIAEILLPVGADYSIHLEFEPDYDVVPIPNKPFYGLKYKIFYDKYREKTKEVIMAGNPNTLVRFQLNTPDGTPLSEAATFKSVSTGKEYELRTNAEGYAEIKIPKNDRYLVSYAAAPDYDLFQTPDKDNHTLNFSATYGGSSPGAVYPSRNRALFTFLYLGLDSLPVPNETFYLQSVNTGQRYTTKTDGEGKAWLLVPIGDTYETSTKYRKRIDTERIPNKNGLYQKDITFYFVSSAEYEERRAAWNRRLLEREVEWERMKVIYDNARRRSAKEYASLIDYKPAKDTVMATVFQRHPQWTNKLVVLDVTGSMKPYNDHATDWFTNNYSDPNPNQFVFFNDGDGISDNQKITGATGGVHFCPDCAIGDFMDSLSNARGYGYGGAGPENDVEALMTAIAGSQGYSDVVLVADNFSEVRDIDLASRIGVPVRVVLCGVEDDFVLPEYLDLAYHTGGSIHTFDKDIYNISQTRNGSKVQIGKQIYILSSGGFVHYKDGRPSGKKP